MRRLSRVVLVLAVALPACGGGQGTGTTAAGTTAAGTSVASTTAASTTSVAEVGSPSTSAATATTLPPTTTSSTTTATTTSSTTTTTAAEDLVLAADGLTVADFGDGPDATLAALVLVLGPSSEDTGWFAGDQGSPFPCAEDIRQVTWRLPGTEGMTATTLVATFHDLFSDDPVFAMWQYYSTFGYDDAQPEPGWLSTAQGLSVGDTYTEAVGYGFELGGYEEPGDGNLAGIRVSIFSPTGDYAADGRVGAMHAGSPYCDLAEP